MSPSPKYMRRECGIACLTSTPFHEKGIPPRSIPEAMKILGLPLDESTKKEKAVVKCRELSVAMKVLGGDSTPIRRPPLYSSDAGQVKQDSLRFTFMADSPVPCNYSSPYRFFIQHYEQSSPSSNFLLIGCRMLKKLQRHSWRLIRKKLRRFEKRSAHGFSVRRGYEDDFGSSKEMDKIRSYRHT